MRPNILLFCYLLFLNFWVSAQTIQVNNNFQTEKIFNTDKETPEELVQRQVVAYNARDIIAFMATYSESILINNFPEVLLYIGQEDMRKRYQNMFETTPDLFCEIKKRIVLKNKVIDHEYVRKDGSYVEVIAIYEVNEGKITKVTFIR